jgi:hypothetical protein
MTLITVVIASADKKFKQGEMTLMSTPNPLKGALPIQAEVPFRGFRGFFVIARYEAIAYTIDSISFSIF